MAHKINYKAIKKKLSKFIKNESYNDKNILETINDAVNRTNKIVFKTHLLLRLWLLDKYNKKEEIPNIDTNLISVAFKVFIDSKGKKGVEGNNKIILEEFKNYYTYELFGDLVDGTKLTTILSYYAITIHTSIINNIKNNFINYLNKYINSYFLKKYENEISNKDFKTKLYVDLKVIKNDILNNILESNSKYHEWINTERPNMVPILKPNESIYPDLYSNPLKYLKYMIYMTGELEKMEKKQFQFFPLHSGNTPNNIKLDTKALIDLFETSITQKYKVLESIKNKLWLDIFNLDNSIKKSDIKDYVFNYSIETDGFSTSIIFIDAKEGLKKKKELNIKKQKAKQELENKLKGLSKEDKIKVKKELNNEKKEKERKYKEEQKIKITNKIKENKEKKKNKDDVKNIKEDGKIKYIDDVDKEELKGKHIFIDPGKRALFTMVDDNNNYFKYTNRQYMGETKRLKYSKKLDKIKTELNITPIEHELTDYNSKTIIITKFKNFIKKKIEINIKVLEKYNDYRFRKYRWYSYINRKRTDDNMLNKIENKYSKEHKIIIGDWSIGKQMSNYISTPNIRLKRKLQERFSVYNIDEFRTSCLNYKTEKKCDNLYLPGSNNKLYKIHSILTFKMENNRLGCINRDKNGCNNIKKLFNSYTTTGTIPEVYKRSYKFEEKQKPSTVIIPTLDNCQMKVSPLNRVD